MKVPKAFYSLQTVGRMLGMPTGTVKSIYSQHEKLENVQAISPIAHLFVRFEEGEQYSYAIRKSYFDKWRETGRVPPKRGRPKMKDGLTQREQKHLLIPAPPFYDRFVDGIDAINATSRVRVPRWQVVHIAMKEYMDRHPKIFPPEETTGVDQFGI